MKQSCAQKAIHHRAITLLEIYSRGLVWSFGTLEEIPSLGKRANLFIASFSSGNNY